MAFQLDVDLELLSREIEWALGEMRINKVMPTRDEYLEMHRHRDGLLRFWAAANGKLAVPLTQDEVVDVWKCVDLTLNVRKRKKLEFVDYLTIAMTSEQVCEYCGRRPPEVRLDIDHILPVSRGGTNSSYNLRFLCVSCNRARGNRFHWAEVWRRI